MSSNVQRIITTSVLTLPITVWALDQLYSTCRVRGDSMEPSLKDGDLVLVRKSDTFTNYSFSEVDGETDRARINRIEATVNGVENNAIISTPPMVLTGEVIVFLDPHAFPNKTQIKRVIGVGGQMVRSGHGHYNTIESIPPYSLWAEADNKEYSEESNNHGPISKKLLIGQAERIVWPLSRWKKIERIFPSAGKAWWP
mmetsp:Transcript_42834/g.48672  ORF Transcript_42834/g.48672 Transcript_42834/m.48672 type:complete len:198 (-) Transcript_42834:128-721(-)